ncbi:sensor histidine kinase [Protaetiibacter sp. SSC-01]|uniref:sensor histidine kinase n=1 Tax=Protaetiibacter sp. SSC-01 TaxID=2759943 RepID=UPI001656A466|nr:sensor histidine kinase [Protaetiibacter sp. SSC-01]QNO38671.1 sensor histidine kinase [Protaetiibacter sp. SSC-01]
MPGPHTHADGPRRGGGPWALGESDGRRPGGSPALRLWIPVILSALVQLAGVAALLRFGHHPPGVAALTVALALAGPAALIGARRFPGPIVVITAVLAVATMAFGALGGPIPLAFAFALAGAVVRGARVWAWASLAGAWLVVLVLSLTLEQLAWPPPRVIGTALGLVIAIGFGEMLAARRQRMAAFRAAAARRRQTAAEEERMRIARELHDVLAHSLSQINVQAGVGLHLADTQPGKAVEALASIKQASKTALDDVRAVLGVLREDGEAPRAPQPDAARIADLVAATDVPGAEVVLDDGLEGELPSPVGAAAYRIVQEGLTNVARHGADVTRVEVRLSPEPGGIRVEVADDGRAASVVPGRGLTGMRERVEQLGGAFELVPGEGLTVRAHLPTTASTGEERP